MGLKPWERPEDAQLCKVVRTGTDLPALEIDTRSKIAAIPGKPQEPKVAQAQEKPADPTSETAG
ncbi:MAG: hypothetical protein V1926_00375 [Candidatus Peregrinibacteria bacterium]